MKKLLLIRRNDARHWVGDGFPVRSIFTYNDLAKDISPFLLMDYAGPAEFPPTEKKLGVGAHPHRGFETVTIVYAGEVEHRDSAGGGGIIKAGDAQWMTAASGLIHEEFHGREFARTGGRFEMVQLWVNLPKKFKMAKPRYQAIKSNAIPTVLLGDGASTLRVIAGEYAGKIGPSSTFTPINLWDLRLSANKRVTLEVPEGHTTTLFVLQGQVRINNSEAIVGEAELGVLEREGDKFELESVSGDAIVLFLGGEPLNEPIVGYGPFVMNTRAEIQDAFKDFEAGKMGVIGKIEGTE